MAGMKSHTNLRPKPWFKLEATTSRQRNNLIATIVTIVTIVNRYNTSGQFNWFAKNCHHFAFKFFVDSHQFKLEVSGLLY